LTAACYCEIIYVTGINPFYLPFSGGAVIDNITLIHQSVHTGKCSGETVPVDIPLKGSRIFLPCRFEFHGKGCYPGIRQFPGFKISLAVPFGTVRFFSCECSSAFRNPILEKARIFHSIVFRCQADFQRFVFHFL